MTKRHHDHEARAGNLQEDENVPLDKHTNLTRLQKCADGFV